MTNAANTPTIIAHRGFAGAYPENTAHAARNAGTHDAVEMIEVDVMPTRDGTVVCFHDEHLHRTDRSRGITDARGTVWETDTETVLNATVLESGATIPRLESVLDALPAGVGINVELKNPGSALSMDERALWDPFVTAVLEILDRFRGPVLFSSFHEGAIASLRERDADLPVGILVRDSVDAGLTRAERYDATAIHPPWSLVLDQSTEIDVVERAHNIALDVNVWTVDTWYRAAQLARMGVDGLIVDYPCIGYGLETGTADENRG